jgi:hypothetical protein
MNINMDINTLSDPAGFAQAIRDLAGDAHRTLTHASSPVALRKLSGRIERLSSALGDRRGGPIGTWLESLGREVRSAAALSRPAIAAAPLWDPHVENRWGDPCPMSS